jgi:hypothetical protein
MKPDKLIDTLLLAPDRRDNIVLIQLPDDEPPVQFQAEWFEDTLILFPVPQAPHTVWDHETNVIKSH